MRMLATTALLGFLLAGVAGAGTARSGLTGLVTRGPVPCPGGGEGCTAPAAEIVLTFKRNGRMAGRVTTRDDGSYRIALPAGRYTVATSPRRTIAPEAVSVVAGRFRTVGFSLHTGSR
jgi:hypothetical protein